MSAETDEMVDVDDLEMLDDDRRHARCTFCQPVVAGPLVPFQALCGIKAVYLTPWDSNAKPPNACEACEVAWPKPCRKCGR